MDFSIIIPHFNRLKRLNMLLWRLLHGTYNKDKYEVIVVDGGTDKARLDEFSLKWSEKLNLILINVPYNKWVNPSKPRNIGYKIARGHYCVMLDADYLPSELLLEKFWGIDGSRDYIWGYAIDSSYGIINKKLKCDPEDFLYKKFNVGWDDTLNKTALYKLPFKDLSRVLGVPLTRWNKEPWLYCVKTDLIKSIRGYDEDYTGWGKEDSDIYLRFKHGLKLNMPKESEAACIHIYHWAAGPSGLRDSSSNTKILLEKTLHVANNYVRNDNNWGEIPKNATFITNWRTNCKENQL